MAENFDTPSSISETTSEAVLPLLQKFYSLEQIGLLFFLNAIKISCIWILSRNKH